MPLQKVLKVCKIFTSVGINWKVVNRNTTLTLCVLFLSLPPPPPPALAENNYSSFFPPYVSNLKNLSILSKVTISHLDESYQQKGLGLYCLEMKGSKKNWSSTPKRVLAANWM